MFWVWMARKHYVLLLLISGLRSRIRLEQDGCIAAASSVIALNLSSWNVLRDHGMNEEMIQRVIVSKTLSVASAKNRKKGSSLLQH